MSSSRESIPEPFSFFFFFSQFHTMTPLLPKPFARFRAPRSVENLRSKSSSRKMSDILKRNDTEERPDERLMVQWGTGWGGGDTADWRDCVLGRKLKANGGGGCDNLNPPHCLPGGGSEEPPPPCPPVEQLLPAFSSLLSWAALQT